VLHENRLYRVLHGRAALLKVYLTVYYTVRANIKMGFQLRVLSVSGKIMSSTAPNLLDKETRAFSLSK
jgi:hypothetical protein